MIARNLYLLGPLLFFLLLLFPLPSCDKGSGIGIDVLSPYSGEGCDECSPTCFIIDITGQEGDGGEILVEIRSDLDGTIFSDHPSADGDVTHCPAPLTPGLHNITVEAKKGEEGAEVSILLEVFPFGYIFGMEKGYGDIPDFPPPLEFFRYPGNPVLKGDGIGTWEGDTVRMPTVVHDGERYRMWYSGQENPEVDSYRIGEANSSNGIDWEKYEGNPVLDLGPAGSFDSDSMNTPCVLFDGLDFHMWYNGRSGNLSIGYAFSTDGIVWEKHEGNPVLKADSPWEGDGIAHPAVLNREDTGIYEMWYSSGSLEVGHAISLDGKEWVKYCRNPVLVGEEGWEQGAIKAQEVLYNGEYYEMWYSGGGKTDWKIGYCSSIDGMRGGRYGGNPVMSPLAGEWESVALMNPFVIKEGGTYRMWYSGTGLTRSSIGYAFTGGGADPRIVHR